MSIECEKAYRTIQIPQICDPRGNLSFVEEEAQLPFTVGKVEWIYDIPALASVEGNAFPPVRQLIVALSGSFNVEITAEEGNTDVVPLNSPGLGLIIEAGVQRRLAHFSTNAVCLLVSAAPAEFCHCNSAADSSLVTPSMVGLHSHTSSSIAQCRLIELPRTMPAGNRGGICSIDNCSGSPFQIRRVYYLYDLPCDAERGGHSHKQSLTLLVAVSGCFDVTLDDGAGGSRTFTLNRPYQALFVPTGLWRTLENFSSGSVCLSLSSTLFAETDYVREYDLFRQLTSIKTPTDEI